METLPGSPEPPAGLAKKYAAWRWEVAYQYGPEVITYRLTSPSDEERFLKLARGQLYPSSEEEKTRMSWAVEYLPV